jgi:hypothetical protein
VFQNLRQVPICRQATTLNNIKRKLTNNRLLFANYDMEHIPEIFRFSLETSSYKDLKLHHFLPEEKSFLCEEIDEHCLLDPTNENGEVTVFGLSQRYNIPRRSLRDWKAAFDEGRALLGTPGRPRLIDPIEAENVNQKLQNDRNAYNASSMKTFENTLRLAVVNSKRRRMNLDTLDYDNATFAEETFEQVIDNHKENEEDIIVSKASKSRFKRKQNIAFRKPQPITTARMNALRDIRITFKLACLLTGNPRF